MTEKIRVIVVDDHSLFRAGVTQSLEMDDMIEVVGEGASASEAIDLAKSLSPDIALLDISMPGNGIEAARQIRQLPSSPQVAMLTVSEDDDDVLNALDAGAFGYLLKGIRAQDLILAVKSVAAGETFVSPNLALRLLATKSRAEENPLTHLSEQEQRTLRLVAKGMSNYEIGEHLNVQERTVKYHMTNILKKLKVRNRVEATLIAKSKWRDLEESYG